MGLKLAKYIGKKSRFRVQSQHVTRQLVNNCDAATPETATVRINQKWFQWIRYLSAHIRVGQIQAGKDNRL